MHPLVRQLLLQAQVGERTTTGIARRSAFRASSHLICGALWAGIPVEEIAEVLHVRPASIEARGGDDDSLRYKNVATWLGPERLQILQNGAPDMFPMPASGVDECSSTVLIHAILALTVLRLHPHEASSCV